MLDDLHGQTIGFLDQVRLQNIFWFSHRFDIPRNHEGDAVRIMGGEIEIVQSDQHGKIIFVCQFAHQFQQANLILQV